MKKISLLFVTLLLVVAFSCKKKDNGEPNPDQTENSSFSVSKSQISAPYIGLKDTIEISAILGWSIVKSDDANWLTINPTRGSGDAQVTISIDKNPNEQERNGDLKIQGRDTIVTVRILQEGNKIATTKADTTLTLSSYSAKDTLKVNLTGSLNITSPSEDWVSVKSLEDTAVEIIVTENFSSARRLDAFSVSSNSGTVSIKVVQKGNELLDTNNPITMKLGTHYLDLDDKEQADNMKIPYNKDFQFAAGESFSISMKVKMGQFSKAEPRLVGTFRSGGRENFQLIVARDDGKAKEPNGKLRLEVSSDGKKDYSSDLNGTTARINDGEWHQVVAVFDATAKETYFYIDGKKDGVADHSDLDYKVPIDEDDQIPFVTIGDFRADKGGWNFGGDITDIRFYNKALTKEDVYADAANLISPDLKSTIIAAYNFDEVSGTTVSDASGNGHDGTLVRGAQVDAF